MTSYPRTIAGNADLYAQAPAARLGAARALRGRAAARLQRRVGVWPESSPGSVNAALLLVTTKPPVWRDPLYEWRERPLAVGEPHEGFFYPDPLGFWTEVRRWSILLFRRFEPGWGPAEALALTTLLHVGDDPARLARARGLCRPLTVLFLDEPGWRLSGLEVRATAYHVPDPHRQGQVYEGFWGHDPTGTVVGKAPQHPTTHRLYRAADMDRFLAGAPMPPPPAD